MWGTSCSAQSVQKRELPGDFESAATIVHDYPGILPDITYRTANNTDLKLDLYVPQGAHGPKPTLMFIHGGGWMSGYTKETFQTLFLPFLSLNWVVVNVDYRPSGVALAPAAVEDCLCAMRWISRNAAKYGIDIKQLVIMGNSAGGHLALTTGMIPLSSSGLGAPCTEDDGDSVRTRNGYIKPAAIVNWYGITDVADVLEGTNQQSWAVMWLGNQPDRIQIANSVSPINYIHPGLPPIITVHGDHDDGVPYSQAVRLHAALTKAGVKNKLVTIKGGGHGNFDLPATRDAYVQIFDFLSRAGVSVQPE